MKNLLDAILRLLKSQERIECYDHAHSVIVCSDCNSDVILPKNHWAHPTVHEDIDLWNCPPCLNKTREVRGKGPLDKNGRTIY